MAGKNSIEPSKNNNISLQPSKERNLIPKKVKAFGRTVAVAIAKAFCKLGSIIYIACKYRGSSTNIETLEKLANNFHDLPILVQRMIKVAYPEIAEHIPVHPIEQISICFDENLQLETSGNTLEEKVKNAKLIPNENNNITLNGEEILHALVTLNPNQLEKLLSLIDELINNKSLSVKSVNEIQGDLSLIEKIMYQPDIDLSTLLDNLKLLLDFIWNLKISELDKSKILLDISFQQVFSAFTCLTSSQKHYTEKVKYFLDFLTSKIQQFENQESKDYFTKELSKAIIKSTIDPSGKGNSELYSLHINFILDSNLFDRETIKTCLHNLCNVAVDNFTNNTVEEALSKVLQTTCLLLETIRETNKLDEKDKTNMVFQLSSLQCEILKSNNPEWLELYTKQLLKFASTIEDLAIKKQLFSIIATLNYGSNINESIFNKYIELIENDNNLKPEDKKPIVEMLENEKLIIKSPILFANDRLRNLIMQSAVVIPSNRKNMTYMLEEAKNILTRTTEDNNLVAVLSSENKKPPIVCNVMLNNIDKMIAFDMLINDIMWTITNTIADIYEAGKISKEDVRKICSLDAVINNEQLKGVLRTQLQENSHLEKLIIASIRSPMHIKGRHDIVGEILAEELREIRN